MGYGNEAAFQTHYRTITVGGTMYRTNADGSNRDDRWYCGDGSCDHYTGEDGSNYGACVSIWAPGWNMRLASGSSATSYRPAGAASSGTSFSAPLVAGLVARLLEKYPTMSATDVWPALQSRATLASISFDPSRYNNNLVYLSPFE